MPEARLFTRRFCAGIDIHEESRRACTGRGSPSRAADRMGQDDCQLVDAQDQGPASERFHHGGENGRALSAINQSVAINRFRRLRSTHALRPGVSLLDTAIRLERQSREIEKSPATAIPATPSEPGY